VRTWLLAALLVAPLVAGGGEVGTGEAGAQLVLLLFHPFPDAADPLGFPFPDGGDRDAYVQRHAHLDAERDGFDFPHAVVDGVASFEGLPPGDTVYATLREGYRAAVLERSDVEAAATLAVATTLEGDAVLAAVHVTPRAALPDADLRLWVALVEDPVEFAPPPTLSNGVTTHRMTVRAVRDAGPVDLGGAELAAVPTLTGLAIPDGSDLSRLLVAAWLQQGAGASSRFAPHEVVQATLHPLAADEPTVQTAKAVLMEMYSATWCDPCLLGDRAAEELADEYGIASLPPLDDGARYLRPVAAWIVVAAVVGGLAVAVAPVGGRRP
jgi:thiol-disulfide isomerase/thioredoxin